MPRRPRQAASRTATATAQARLRRLCLGLSGAGEEQTATGLRWVVAGRAFAELIEPGGAGARMALTVRSAGFLLEALRRAGPPYFVPPTPARWGTEAIGVWLGPRPPWPEIAILVADSHRLLSRRRRAAG